MEPLCRSRPPLWGKNDLHPPARPAFHETLVFVQENDDFFAADHILALPDFRLAGQGNFLLPIRENRLLRGGQTIPLLHLNVPRGHHFPDFVSFVLLLVKNLGRIGVDDQLPLTGFHLSPKSNHPVLIVRLKLLGRDSERLFRSPPCGFPKGNGILLASPSQGRPKKEDRSHDKPEPNDLFHGFFL
jgi:hypothetical protein